MRRIRHGGEDKERPRIVIKKVRIKHGTHHTGAWKVAYADFVTAMMALFIVLWIMAAASPDLKAGLAQYFRDPGVFERSHGLIPQQEGGEAPVAIGRNPLETLEERLRVGLQQLKEFAAIEDQITIRLTPEGLLVEITDNDTRAFFDLSSAELKPIMRKILHVIVDNVKELPNQVAISGHTDARPYRSRSFYSNWELSAARALNTRRAMEEMGFPPTRVDRVVGYADRLPFSPEDPLSPVNRRISIVVLRNSEQKTPLSANSPASAPGSPRQ